MRSVWSRMSRLTLAFSAMRLYSLGLGNYGELLLFGETLTTIRIDQFRQMHRHKFGTVLVYTFRCRVPIFARVGCHTD